MQKETKEEVKCILCESTEKVEYIKEKPVCEECKIALMMLVIRKEDGTYPLIR